MIYTSGSTPPPASVPVSVELGPTGDEQESDFQNGTLQNHGHTAFTIQTWVEVPDTMNDDPRAVAEWLDTILTRVHDLDTPLTFDVQVGEEDGR